MDHQLRHSNENTHQSESDTRLTARSEARAVASAESILARDAASHPVPPAVGERLSRAIASKTPPKPGSWWSRLLRRP